MDAHSYRGDLNNPGCYTIMRGNEQVGAISFLEPLSATTLRIFCEVLDTAAAIA